MIAGIERQLSLYESNIKYALLPSFGRHFGLSKTIFNKCYSFLNVHYYFPRHIIRNIHILNIIFVSIMET